MNCIKCGRETGADNAFCDACLEEMSRRPVNPATVVLLPGQGRPQPKKAAPKKALPSMEEQVGILRKKVRRMRIMILVLVMLVVVLGFVLFNAADLTQAGQDMAAMVGLRGLPLISTEAVYFLRSYAVLFLAGIVGATPLVRNLTNGFENRFPSACAIAEPVILAAIWLLCTACLVDGSFNPFLYFRF